jgi:alpha-galactosidase
VPLVGEHPEYLLDDPINPANKNHLLNLGNPEAFDYVANALCSIIERLGVDCYRQDFNFRPLPFWRANDTEDRRGITEIKHIMGLYRLWDLLLARFPGLIIDNCASGGKRLDMETAKRSFALWRSDAQCPADPNPEITQLHNMNFALWLPDTGTGSGRVYDTYTMRSSYAPGLSTTYAYSDTEHFGAEEGQVEWLAARFDEMRRVRPYFAGDIYHLTKPTKDDTAWCAVQWDRPECGDGMVQVFKRKDSPYTEAYLPLRRIDPAKTYHFTDVDGGEFYVSGKELSESGLHLTVRERRVAKIYFYRVDK